MLEPQREENPPNVSLPSCPRILRWLFRLYPRPYRERYADEVAACLRRDLERSGGGVRFWAGVVWDHLRASAAVRRRERHGKEGRMRTVLEDFRHGARTLRRAPTFTAFATLTLALGIGATTAAYAVLDRVVLRPLPYPGAERMVVVGPSREADPERVGTVSTPLMVALQESPGPAEAIVGLMRGYSVLIGLGDPERVYPAEVTAGFFPFFGGAAVVGRLLSDEDHVPGAQPVAVLGHGFWRTRFGGGPAVVGTTIALDSVRRTIVGVLSEDFVPPEQIMMGAEGDIWVPLPLAERIGAAPAAQLISYTVFAVARLGANISPQAMEGHAARVIEDVYGGYPRGVVGATSQSLHALTVGDIHSVLWRVFAAVALLLVIACVNVASLLLTRSSERVRELAVRSALGAGRGRLVRQLLSESVLFALGGAALGAAVAFVAVEGFRRFSPGGVPRLGEVVVDGRALGFSVTVALAAVLLFGLLPALRATARSAAPGPRQSTPGRADARLRGTLVFAETALAVVLVAGSGLLVHDLVRRIQEDPGYRPEELVAMRVTLPFGHYGDDRRASFWRELVEGARALPGVTSIAITSELPTTDNRMEWAMTPQGHQESEGISNLQTGGAFDATVGLTVVDGRWFSDYNVDGEPVAVVNEAFVRAYWPDESSVIGRTIQVMGGDVLRVVGVAADARVEPGVGPRPKVYRPIGVAVTSNSMEIVARADANPAALTPELRALVQRLDPGLVDVNIRTVASLNAQALARPRFYTTLFSSFGLIAFLLALVGVYGTTTYAARSRTREIGIRMALGARRTQVVRQVVVRTLLVVAGGIAVGLLVAVLTSRALTDALLTIGARDALTYATVAALVLAAGAAAALVPAERASRVDPASTLREDG